MPLRLPARRSVRTATIGVVLAMLLAPVASTTATPLMSTKAFDALYVQYDTLPEFQPGTHDTLTIMLGHGTWTENGVVTEDWYNFELYLGRYITVGEDNHFSPVWTGEYYPPLPVAPVSFGPRTAFGTRTLTWRCYTGDCPTMPATIEVTITATAVGPPRTQTRTGPGSPGPATGVFQEYDATVTVDTGGAITLPPLVTWSWLQHFKSRTVEH
jgi:hypothetical protein